MHVGDLFFKVAPFISIPVAVVLFVLMLMDTE